MDWWSVLTSKSAEEEEKSMLVVGFVAQMCKQTADLDDEPTPTSDRKHPRRSSLNEDAQKN